jgi:hypothetical protein
MYLLVIFIILFILLLIELEFDITSRIYKKLKSYLGHSALTRLLALILIAYAILLVILVLVIKFLFEYNGLANGYLHYIFLIFVGLIGLIPIYVMLIYGEEIRTVQFFLFLKCVFFFTFIAILDEFLINAFENRNF